MADNEKNLLTIYSQFLDASGEHLTYAALSTYRNSARELSQKEKDGIYINEDAPAYV